MTVSLKVFTPSLAQLLGITPAALYERQRALVRAGLLDAAEGHGPGSGVRTTAASVSLLLISAMVSESLAEAELRTGDIAAAAPVDGECQLTGMRSFQDALASTLTAASQSARVVEISVSRTAARAKIVYRDGRRTATSEFIGPGSDEPGLSVVATLAGDTLRFVAHMVRETVSLPEDVYLDERGWQRTASGQIDFNTYR
jgi:DNA-binding IscR family transcriptional regulator